MEIGSAAILQHRNEFAICTKHGGWPPKTNIFLGMFDEIVLNHFGFFVFPQGCREMDIENSIVFGIGLGWYKATRSLFNPLEFGISRHPSEEPVH